MKKSPPWMGCGASANARYAATDHAGSAQPLRDCIQLKPLSTVGDCFIACKRAGLCSGDFVRAEGRAAAEVGSGGVPARPVKKDDVVSTSLAILRIQSTKKSQWQQ